MRVAWLWRFTIAFPNLPDLRHVPISGEMRACLPVCLVLLCGGCVTMDRDTAPSSTVSRGKVYQAADQIRREGTGRQIGAGAGISMAPLYGENTTLVITPVEFDMLERGMIVAYRSKDGRRIVHRLEFKSGDNWIARGINNDELDPEPVTRDNLLGVVYAVLTAAPLVVPEPAQ